MTVELRRALNEFEYRESVAGSHDPVVRLLERAGAYAYDHHETTDYNDWNGAVVGSGPGPVIRPAVPLDPALPFGELQALLTNGARARVLVARHPSTPVSNLRELAEDEDAEVQGAVLANVNADEALLERLSRSRFPQVRSALASHPRLTAALVEVLLADAMPEVGMRVMWRKDLDASTLARILERYPAHAAWVAGHKNVTPELLRVLADSTSLTVRTTVAKNPRSTREALEQISKQEMDWNVRRALAGHALTPDAVLLRLTEDPKLRLAISERKSWPAELQVFLARDSQSDVRKAIATRGDEQAAIEVLLGDPDTGTRAALARNPHCRHFERLGADEMSPVRQAVAERGDAPRALMERLALDSQSVVSRAAAQTLKAMT